MCSDAFLNIYFFANCCLFVLVLLCCRACYCSPIKRTAWSVGQLMHVTVRVGWECVAGQLKLQLLHSNSRMKKSIHPVHLWSGPMKERTVTLKTMNTSLVKWEAAIKMRWQQQELQKHKSLIRNNTLERHSNHRGQRVSRSSHHVNMWLHLDEDAKYK